MMKKSGAGWLRFFAVICLCGTGIASWGAGENGATAGAGDTASGEHAQRRLTEIQDRLGQIDRRQVELAGEEEALRDQVRTVQRDQYNIHQQLLESDAETREIVQRVEALQKELHSAQEMLAQRMAARPDYAENQARQATALERTGALQRESMALANERVRLQLEQQELERQIAAPVAGVVPGAAGGGTSGASEEAVP